LVYVSPYPRSDGTVQFGSGGGVVEVDETFIGHKHRKAEGARGYAHKNAMLTLIDRKSGKSKSFTVENVKASTLLPILRENIAKEAIVYTDEAKQYGKVGSEFAEHDFTTHSKGEYVRGNVHTNTLEGYFSIFKRGMKGIYQHCGKQHLHRYAAEFEFRYNNRIANGVNDLGRANVALMGIVGKRVLYRDLLGA
jgi:transposase-like protein